MKLPLKLIVLTLLFVLPSISLFAQGSLTPPGAPAPMMKTLDQIEPRTPIDATHTPGGFLAQFIISQPGSYYLTSNIVGIGSKRGIEVDVGNVTIDLNGFSLIGASNSYDGIYSAYPTNDSVVVRNGTIIGWPSGGITYSASGGMFENLTLAANLRGISVGANCIVRNCTIVSNIQSGIQLSGPGNFVSGNVCAGNNTQNNASYGGIVAFGGRNRIEGNHVTGSGTNGYGIYFGNFSTNVVIQNTVIGGSVNNYASSAGNVVGPIISVLGTITNTVPWANFSY